jgi:hypothetical protein
MNTARLLFPLSTLLVSTLLLLLPVAALACVSPALAFPIVLGCLFPPASAFVSVLFTHLFWLLLFHGLLCFHDPKSESRRSIPPRIPSTQIRPRFAVLVHAFKELAARASSCHLMKSIPPAIGSWFSDPSQSQCTSEATPGCNGEWLEANTQIFETGGTAPTQNEHLHRFQ